LLLKQQETLLSQLLMLLTQQLILHAAGAAFDAADAATDLTRCSTTHALHAADSVRNYPYHYQRLPRPVELAN
jgi:hypothetical protein